MLALSFARSTVPMAFALRFSILPLIDSIMRSAFDRGVEPVQYRGDGLSAEHSCEIRRSSIDLQRFSLTHYFETELQRFAPPKARVRKAPDS